jgi:hypothetical protein
VDEGDERRPLRPRPSHPRAGDCGLNGLDPARTWWVAAVVAPARDWAGAPGCRKGARFVVSRQTLRPGHDAFTAFDSRGECLRWILAHRAELERKAPGAAVVPADLARWMLGLE